MRRETRFLLCGLRELCVRPMSFMAKSPLKPYCGLGWKNVVAPTLSAPLRLCARKICSSRGQTTRDRRRVFLNSQPLFPLRPLWLKTSPRPCARPILPRRPPPPPGAAVFAGTALSAARLAAVAEFSAASCRRGAARGRRRRGKPPAKGAASRNLRWMVEKTPPGAILARGLMTKRRRGRARGPTIDRRAGRSQGVGVHGDGRWKAAKGGHGWLG